MDDQIEEVLAFCFECVVENEMRESWCVQDDAFDAEILRRFGEVHRRASTGELDAWTETPKSSLALVIVLDQFSHNLMYCSAAAFANDRKTLATAELAIEKDWDRKFRVPDRVYFYLPHEHSEDLDVQRGCLGLFSKTKMGTEYAEAHMKLIKRFGHFPHRHAVLGRANTPEEDEYLAQPREGFEAG